jgi:hypothetical protein
MRLTSGLLYGLIKEQLEGVDGSSNPDFSNWKINAHHVTLNMGSWKGTQQLGTWFDIEVDGLYFDDKVAAVRVTNLSNQSGDQLSRSDDAKMHITIAVSPIGTAKDSNSLPWNKSPNQRINMTLKGQLQDPKGKDGAYKTDGGYSGVVLDQDDHGKLLKELALQGFNFPENLAQKWADGSPTFNARESFKVPLTRIRSMIREELSGERRN